MNNYFDEKECIEQIRLRDILKDGSDTVLKRKDEILRLEADIDYYKWAVLDKKQDLKSLKGLKNFLFNRIIVKSEKKILNNFINEAYDEMELKEKKIEQINLQVEKLEQRIKENKNSYKMNLGDGIYLDDGIISINDMFDIGNITSNRDNVFIVHCTDFFPKGKVIKCNYDGNKEFKVPLYYDGVTKEVKHISHRHTCHFIKNNVVQPTGDGNGNWDNCKFIIIEPFRSHEEQFSRNSSPSDSWIYGSVALSDKPLLLVRKDDYNDIPIDERENYSVIQYEGNYVTCTQKILEFLGAKLENIDSNSPNHMYSLEMNTEIILDARDMAINYLKNNKYDGKSKINLNEEELFYFFEIAKNARNCPDSNISTVTRGIDLEDIEQETGIEKEFMEFIIGYGVKKENDTYTFKDDNELYQDFSSIENDENEARRFRTHYNLDELENLFIKYKKFCEEKKQMMSTDFTSDVARCSLDDLYKFENIDSARIVFNKLNEICMDNTFIMLSSDGVSLKFSGLSELYDESKIISMGIDINEVQKINANNVTELLKKVSFLTQIVTSAGSNHEVSRIDKVGKTL